MVKSESKLKESEWNMAQDYCARLNNLFTSCDEAALNLNAYQWFHSLKALKRELIIHMEVDESTAFDDGFKVIKPRIDVYMHKKVRSGSMQAFDTSLYDELQNIEEKLRVITHRAGLFVPTKKDVKDMMREFG